MFQWARHFARSTVTNIFRLYTCNDSPTVLLSVPLRSLEVSRNVQLPPCLKTNKNISNSVEEMQQTGKKSSFLAFYGLVC